MKRILGVDTGDVRTGLAVSDSMGFLANGIGTFTEPDEDRLVALVVKYAADYDVGTIVVGNPINMDGSAGSRSQKVCEFADKVRKCVAEKNISVTLFDERCTTMEAHRIMNITNTRGKKRKAAVDTLSAQIILQDYLDFCKSSPQN